MKRGKKGGSFLSEIASIFASYNWIIHNSWIWSFSFKINIYYFLWPYPKHLLFIWTYLKNPFIMIISIILDPCNDFPAFFGNARIYFFKAISKSSAFFIWTFSKKNFIIKISIILDPIFQMLHPNHIQGCCIRWIWIQFHFYAFLFFSPYYEYPGPLWKNLSLVYLSSIRWFTTYYLVYQL